MVKSDKNLPPQLPLDLELSPATRRDDLIESAANKMALNMIDSWPNWPGQVTILAGPVGSGKSHIGAVWAEMSDARIYSRDALEAGFDKAISDATAGRNLVLEDLGTKSIDEPPLFHLLNSVREAGSYLLVTSRIWPREWDISLPDLRSRLTAAQLVELLEPDDMLIKEVMAKLFHDRQLKVEPHVIEYCVLRMERSLESAAKLVKAMDEEALARKSLITRATASSALERLGMA
ncbi:MAG: DnaA/Hda family protein [Rhizobiaceae bacterium]|nr:DnaA/Hda family protein [Rhizobiaceae bacterium]